MHQHACTYAHTHTHRNNSVYVCVLSMWHGHPLQSEAQFTVCNFDCRKATHAYINLKQKQSHTAHNSYTVINTLMDTQAGTSKAKTKVMTATVEYCTETLPLIY